MRLVLLEVLLLTIALATTGCVTEVKGNLLSKYDPEKAVTDSVAAAMAYAQEGRYQDAHRHLKRASEFDPKSPDVLNAYALLYRVEGDRKLEEEFYQRAIRADGSFSKARNNYAVFLFSQGRYAEAAEELRLVVQDIGYDRRYASFENLGRCYLKLDQRQEAREAFFRSVRLNEKYYPAWLNLVKMSLHDKDFKAARSQLSSYERVGPTTLKSLQLGLTIAKKTNNDTMLRVYNQKMRQFTSPETAGQGSSKKTDAS